MSRIMITGVGGFIGRALAAALVAAGHTVSGTSRRAATAVAGVSVHQIADIGGDVDWAHLVDGIDAVVHLAAQVHAAADDATHVRVNVDGTGRLAAAAAAAGVTRFVFLSTVKVHGEATAPGMSFTEADDPRPEDAYGRSKWEAERLLAGVSGIETAILRPPLVYGPGVGANFATLMRLCASGLPLPFAAIDNRRSLVHVGNLVDAIVLVLTHADAVGGTFLLSDGEPVSTPALIRAIATARGRPARLFAVPPGWLRVGAALVGRGTDGARLTGNLVVDDSLIRSRLGWRPPHTMADGLAAMVAADRGGQA